jgi:uroporphyrinogen-III decarboxylase
MRKGTINVGAGRAFYRHLAQWGICVPIATDLALHQELDPDAVRRDGTRLGNLLARAARRFHSPLAFPLMDLELEKTALMSALGCPPEATAMLRFDADYPPPELPAAVLRQRFPAALPAPLQAQIEAISYIATREPDLVPCAITIGPFSLITKLLRDPIALVYLAGMGVTAEEDRSVAVLERCMDLAMLVIDYALRAQLAAGATLVFVAEPAANAVYLSPRQMKVGSDVFDRLVMLNLRRYNATLQEYGADLWFHDCGELTDTMIRSFCTLDPVVLSLGSSRPLWEVAPLVAESIILYGNLPSRKFSSDAAITVAQVRDEAWTLIRRMRALQRAFLLGTECDVLHVPGCERALWQKIDAMIDVAAEAQAEQRC